MAPNVKTVVFAGALYSAFSFATLLDERTLPCIDPGWSTDDHATSAAAAAQFNTEISVLPSSIPISTAVSMVVTTSIASTASVTADTTSAVISSTSSSEYSGSCDNSSPCTGQMTYYDTATSSSNPSSCGTTNDGKTDLVLALPVGIMTDSDCGRTVSIEYNGVTQTGTVVDKCMGCDDSSIDLSRALFQVFASLSEGRLHGAKWYVH
ncbi:hypothetical protein N7448_011351 [Penicillium atrosanguineum]|nr:hypothetical protein N7448_011351 [Penicillium atrosanguineum]